MASLRLPHELKLDNAEHVRSKLICLLDDEKDFVELDCTDLKEVDSTGLSVLIAFIKTSLNEQVNRKITFTNVSDNLRRLFKMTHLTSIHSNVTLTQ